MYVNKFDFNENIPKTKHETVNKLVAYFANQCLKWIAVNPF